jgi:putative ABC transport system substrate-binding protein
VDRRAFIGILAGGLLAAPLVAQAQPVGKVPRIGYLAGDSAAAHAQYAQAFSNGLRDLGYVEGKNLVIEFRWAEGKFERLPELAAELIRLPVDVIVAVGDPVIFAAKQATSSIPIVMVAVGDPVGRGFVASLARPGGNLTGISNLAVALTGKWLQMLEDTVPQLSEVSVLRNSANPTHPLFVAEAERIAPGLGLKLQTVGVLGSADLDAAFAAMVRERSGALLVLPDPVLSVLLGGRIAELALKNRLPALFAFKAQAEAGGLLSYGPNLVVNFRRAATYVDKILKGAKPGDLPVEQPTQFELVINLKTAKALGLTIPSSLLQRADQVIE